MTSKTTSLNNEFSQLVADVKACRKCDRMCDSERVLGPASGSLRAKVVFIGEAPGRLGADESQIPFHGDKSGHNFESLIQQVGLSRYELFVTNAVLCNPRDSNGNNATPTATEIKNCSHFLKRQIELIDPPLVVTLGRIALNACSLIEQHDLELRTGVRTANSWLGRSLVPAYHPGQRAMLHRSFANQLSDYQFIKEQVARNGVKRKKGSGSVASRGTKELIDTITSQKSDLSYFALHKLFFMIEARALDELGARLSDSYIIRQKDGPYCVELHPQKILALNLNLSMYTRGGVLHIKRMASTSLFDEPDNISKSPFDTPALELISAVISKYGSLSDTELKRAAYCTKAMRSVLRKEKTSGLNLFNAPLLVPAIYD
ncbi:uracil-DNA glycosylase [Collimonas pratensis]|uniref:uracil-DNA glycosylase family protein n=1 Tax=Collimonas pratensis TaxID=279113 RepID=UPI00143CC605|nr:uracil-DNA glycosylase family protein [Collimonas pratensis]NKI72363.1 uracil-DNA glycosylase [Collimonas pratensis]